MRERTGAVVVEIADLHRWLPLGEQRVDILRGISLTIESGEWVALTGPSGSGKSTLLGLIAGLDSADGGSIRIAGKDITRAPERELAAFRNRTIGIVFQSFNLIPTLTAQENVEAPLYVRSGGREARDRARAMLELVGLADRARHRPHQLSGGQQQRVAIARALVTEPTLLLADEPTGNLDTATGAQVLELFAHLQAALGLTLVVVTHDPEVARRADRELHIVDGRLTGAGAPITALPRTPVEALA
jgi:putative ABC transport system ATP-binding protein